MCDLVGNPEARFSHIEAQISLKTHLISSSVIDDNNEIILPILMLLVLDKGVLMSTYNIALMEN